MDAAIVINIIKEWILLLGTEFLSDIRSPFDFTNKFTKSILENGKIYNIYAFMVLYIADEHPNIQIPTYTNKHEMGFL